MGSSVSFKAAELGDKMLGGEMEMNGHSGGRGGNRLGIGERQKWSVRKRRLNKQMRKSDGLPTRSEEGQVEKACWRDHQT